jgi:hypothetical protein
MNALTLSEASVNIEQASDEQLVALAELATTKIAEYTEGLAAATAHRPSYAPKGRETRTERGQFALREDARRLLVQVQVESAKRAGSGPRTLISFMKADGSIKTIVRQTIFTEPQRVAFLASAKAKDVEVIGWRVVQ